MAGKKVGLIGRLMMGSEKSEGYARASLPSNRWELFWDIFKGRFWKLVGINLLMFVFFIPVIAVFVFQYLSLVGYGTVGPYSQCFGIGYQTIESYVGVAERVNVATSLSIYAFLPLALIVAFIGLSGGAYVMRNLVWTEGVFVANDFWRGIKVNFKQLFITAIIYSVILFMGLMALSFADYSLAINGMASWLLVLSKVVIYVLLVFFTIMVLHTVSMSVTYNLSFFKLFRNSFLFTLALLPQSIFFLALAFIPYVFLLFGSFFTYLGVALVMFFGISYSMLVWTDFCQWSYDKFLNERIEGAKINRGIYAKVKEDDSEAMKKYREQLAIYGTSTLSNRPIKPITDDDLTLAELPESFSRSDILKLNQSRKELYEDNERYIEEHKNDEGMKKVNEENNTVVDKEKAEREKRIEKAKKELAKRKKR